MKRLRRLLAVLVAVAIVGGGMFIAPTPAGAVLAAPELVGPANGDPLTSNPRLIWNPVTNADRYQVQYSTSPTFSSGNTNVTTYNTQYSPPTDLALNTWYWHVRAQEPGGAFGDWSETWSFVKNAANSPTPVGPTSGDIINYPDEPLVFSWEPMSGTKNYEIQIDADSNFTSPDTTASTPNTSWVANEPFTMDQTFYWRVRAVSPQNVPTLWSEPIDFMNVWTEVPQLLGPPDTNNPSIEEVVFSWTPVNGAQYYDLEYSVNSNFVTPTSLVQNIRLTQYSPQPTINNGSYFWRVRAKTASGDLGSWSAVHTFTRSWPGPDLTSPQVVDPGPGCQSTVDFAYAQLCTPANGAVATELRFEWTPVRLASEYVLQFSQDQFFSGGVTTVSNVEHTRYTFPNRTQLADGTWYWRVRGEDQPAGVDGIWSATGSFNLQKDMVSLSSPANGAAVATPVLRWNGEVGDGEYTVTIRRQSDGTVAESATVENTAYVPQTLVPAEGPFIWSVQEVGGPAPDPSLQRTFSLVAPTTTGSPNPLTPTLGNVYAPVLEWSARTSATRYQVEVKAPSSGSFAPLAGATNLAVAGFAYSGYDLEAGTWEWRVRAFNGGTDLGTGDVGTFHVLGILTTQLLAPDHCPASLACAELNDTPTLEWNPVPGVTSYNIRFAHDVNFTNSGGLPGGAGGISVTSTSYTPPESLFDSQAGQAIYWYVRASGGPEAASFATDPNTPVRAFKKRSVPVELLSPANNAGQNNTTFGNQITFTWRDYLRTNNDATPRNTQVARQYRIQVSDVADFSGSLETNEVVDQTTYTNPKTTYPDGPLYWRVQAIDGTNNSLTWSEVRIVHKQSPVPTQIGPADGASVGAVPVVTWAPQLFAAAYDIEIYKNPNPPEQGLIAGNRVYQLINTRMTAAAAPIALPSGEYGWRIRRKDADGKPGPWSTETNGGLRKFTLEPQAPSLVSPPNGGNVTSNSFLLDWETVPGATQYRVQVSTTNTFTTTKENVVTVMSEWAPIAKYDDGTYYWRVQSLDSAGNVLATSETRSFLKSPPIPEGTLFTGIAPKRILDSRPAFQVGPYSTPWSTGQTREVEVAGGSTTVPANATAVTLNVTVTQTTGTSYLSIWPKDETQPTVSNLNWVPGWTVPNSVTVKVGAEGKVNIYNNLGLAHVVVDVVGYYTPDTGAGFTSLQPKRILDSRPAFQEGPYPTPWTSGTTREVQVAGGSTTVPSDAESVVLNVTVTQTNAVGYLSIWPKGQAQPTVSSLNWDPGWTIPNSVTVKVGDNQRINVFNNQGTAHVIIDVVGYFKPGTGTEFHPVSPGRILDSRPGFQVGIYSTPWSAGMNRNVLVTGPSVPVFADAVLMNVTATQTTATSYLSIWPNGQAQPTVSSLNWVAGWTIPNAVTAKIGTGGNIRMYNNLGNVHVIADVAGWYG